MNRFLTTLLFCLLTTSIFANSILIEGFEYANHDLEKPIGWTCDDNSWLCGYFEKDHNRIPHSGNWYAFSNTVDAWMFMPLYMITSMNYRFNCWAISDGEFQLEFWAGTAPDHDSMHTPLLNAIVSGGSYEKLSSYIDIVPNGCEYIGIHAIAGQGATHLTIDDIEVDMVEQYDFEAEAITGDTTMYPGTRASFRFLVHNTGYDPLDITTHPSNEYFSDFNCYVNGTSGMTFPLQPDETIEVTTYATLRPEIEPGSVTWLDIIMTIPCGCNTAMVTFWVTPLEPMSISEDNTSNIDVFPNPTSDYVTIKGEGIRSIKVFDWTGRLVMSVPNEVKQTSLSLNGLKNGSYIIIAESNDSFVRRTIIKQ